VAAANDQACVGVVTLGDPEGNLLDATLLDVTRNDG
jgi:hypothetical protein